MMTVHKVNPKTLRVTIHAREGTSHRTVCGQVVTVRDRALTPAPWQPQYAVTCEKCKKGAQK